MKIVAWISCIFLLGLQAAFGYRPLIGSDWERNNPGQLPFSTCRITHEVANEAGIAGRLRGEKLFGVTIFDGGFNFITCKSNDLGIAFSIPVHLGNLLTFPSALGALHSESKLKFSDNIDGKHLSDLLGTYWGLKCGLSLLIGGCVGKYQNSHGVVSALRQLSISGIELEAGISRFAVRPIPPERQQAMHTKYKSNPFVITARKLAPCSTPPREIPPILIRGDDGGISISAQSGSQIHIGTKKLGCRLNKDELDFNQGLKNARLLELYSNCSILAELLDGTVIFQDGNGTPSVLSDPTDELALEGMVFVRSGVISIK